VKLEGTGKEQPGQTGKDLKTKNKLLKIPVVDKAGPMVLDSFPYLQV